MEVVIFFIVLIMIFIIGKFCMGLIKKLKKITKKSIDTVVDHKEDIAFIVSTTVKKVGKGIETTGKILADTVHKQVNKKYDINFESLNDIFSDIEKIYSKIDKNLFVIECFEIDKKIRNLKREIIELTNKAKSKNFAVSYIKSKISEKSIEDEIENTIYYAEEIENQIKELLQKQIELKAKSGK